MAAGTSLLELSRDELVLLLASWEQPRYRADQIWDWVYRKLIADPVQMTNLPAVLRARLAAETILDPLQLIYEQRSSDHQTVKWLFRLPDGLTIESVLMFYPPDDGEEAGRRTVCISTQAGCAMGCVFCATGQAGLARNLTAGEIIAQVLYAERWLRQNTPAALEDEGGPLSAGRGQLSAGRQLTNVVVMGMGEPLANYERTWQALRTIIQPDGFGLGARHITLSTVGLPTGIRRLADEPLQVNLAVSLHAPNDALRATLVPINRRYPLAELFAAIRDYIQRTNRRVTFEYALMRGINDTPPLARELAALLKPLRSPTGGMMCHVNLIPLNPVAESPYQPSTPEQAATFQRLLVAAGIPTTLRRRRGIDIDAGCGQLRRRVVALAADAGVGDKAPPARSD